MCNQKERRPGEVGESLIWGSDSYHCPTCGNVLAILKSSGFSPTTVSTVTLPAGCDQEYLHIPVVPSVFSKR